MLGRGVDVDVDEIVQKGLPSASARFGRRRSRRGAAIESGAEGRLKKMRVLMSDLARSALYDLFPDGRGWEVIVEKKQDRVQSRLATPLPRW